MSIHSRSLPVRALAATIDNVFLSLSKPKRLADFVKSLLRFPVEYRAARALAAVPESSFGELFGKNQHLNVCIDPAALDRHSWNVKLHEEMYLSAAVQMLKPLRLFEIGTFNGSTTRRLAEAAPEAAQVFTLDLPDDMFDAIQGPFTGGFSGQRIGECYRDSPARAKIQQLRGDAMTFDFSPFYGNVDFIFVDAYHDYGHGLADTTNALRMARPGGTIIWHDFVPEWSGLVHAICEVTAGLPLRRLSGTSMAVLRTGL